MILTFKELVRARKEQGLSNSELMREYDLTYAELRAILDAKLTKKEKIYGKNKQ